MKFSMPFVALLFIDVCIWYSSPKMFFSLLLPFSQLSGALGGGIPIYFGASDIGLYVNTKSFIHCDVSIEEMRSFYPRRQRPRPFLFKNSSWPTDEELLSWADKYLRPQLEPCVKRVIELDSNDEDYMSVLREPFIKNEDIMSGQYPLRGVALAYNILKNAETNHATEESGVIG